MRFLCLHGLGTNSQIFESQTAALRYQLGDQHTFEFVEGNIQVPMAPEFEGVASATDEFFAYLDMEDLDSCVRALDHLDAYLKVEGPFDGLVAFSQGATLSATYLVRKMWQNPEEELKNPTFKCAILFSAGGAYDPFALEKGEIRLLTPEVDGEIIQIPTMHIWGAQDTTIHALEASGVCNKEKRQVYVHPGGHEIPGTRMEADVKTSVKFMRRVLAIAAQ